MKELTDEEHEALAQKSEVPLMVHVHGELDYSIPGTELFNSYLSGVSTNRGYSDILQRELFGAGRQNVRPFNLKDYEMIHMLPRIRALEIPYILIDAKRKPKEYVSRVTRAYYLMLHRRENKPTALQHLAEDLGREKTSYFFGDEKIMPSPKNRFQESFSVKFPALLTTIFHSLQVSHWSKGRF